MRHETKFRSLLGNTIELKIWEALLTAYDFEFKKLDIIEMSQVGRSRGYEVINRFIEMGILRPSKKNPIMFGLNKQNKDVRTMNKLFKIIITS